MDRTVSVNGIEYEIITLLGRGKGGYSYLAISCGRKAVLKQIHHEPCDYYRFGNKIESEKNDYRRLKEAGLNIDYFPTNFVVCDGLICYVDYECNPYMAEWSFENWGIKYWSRTPEFERTIK